MLPTETLIARIARSGLPDDEFAEVVDSLRTMGRVVDAGRELAGAVMGALSFQPATVVNALSAFDAVDPDAALSAVA